MFFNVALNSNDLQFYGVFYNLGYKAKFLNLKLMVSFLLLNLTPHTPLSNEHKNDDPNVISFCDLKRNLVYSV